MASKCPQFKLEYGVGRDTYFERTTIGHVAGHSLALRDHYLLTFICGKIESRNISRRYQINGTMSR